MAKGIRAQKLEETQRLILEAALAEFSERGFDGARMDNIAIRCGRNKALVYRYYIDKEGLFLAVVKAMFRKRDQIRSKVPNSLSEALPYWFKLTDADPYFMRMIIQEALYYTEGDVISEAAFRSDYYKAQIDLLCQWQQEGKLTGDLDPTYFFMALTSMITFPVAYPQITRLMTGQEHSSPKFRKGYAAFLRAFAAQLEQPE